MNLRTNTQRHLTDEFARLYRQGVRRFDFLGGRRSGKTYFILQQLLSYMAQGDVVSVATMTDTQGRLGAYQDAKDIVEGSDLQPYCDVFTSPREIRCKYPAGGRMFFNSYQSSERAKGIACDWLYINEGNNFTEQQYIDLSASVRRGVFVDRNPNSECWTERNGFSLIHSTWQDNKANLTEQQVQWFESLKAKALAPDATGADVAFYRMYYLGEYAEIVGNIFTPGNIRRCEQLPDILHQWLIYCDPSALVGSDFFAMVLCAIGDDGCIYIADVWSENSCGRDHVLRKWHEWITAHDVEHIYCESNGSIGQEFLKWARTSYPALRPYNNGSNKVQRILGNYENICERVVFLRTPAVDEFLAQVYQFEGKNSSKVHDDNIDAVNSAFEIYRRLRLIG